MEKKHNRLRSTCGVYELLVSLKCDTDTIPLFTTSLPIEEVEIFLKIMDFDFDRKLTWNTMIFRLHIGASIWEPYTLYHVREYLDPKDLAIVLGLFVRLGCEYSDAAFISASATDLFKVQKLAERLSDSVFPAL